MKILIILFLSIFLVGFVSAEHQLPTDLVNGTGVFEGFGNWANNVTFGAWWTFMLLGFCIVLFISTVKYGTTRAFGFAGATGLLGSILLLMVGWIPVTFASMFIIVGAISIALMVKNRE